MNTTPAAPAPQFVTLGMGRSVHLAYFVGDRLTGSYCDRAAWETKRPRLTNAERATCARCIKVAASEDSEPNREARRAN